MSGSAHDKRKHERFLVSDAFISVTLRPHGYTKEIWGIVTDTSYSGFQISIPLQLPPDTKVDVTVTRKINDALVETEHLTGHVCWCQADSLLEDTFNIGVEIVSSDSA
jgi:hypothetical protein